MATWNVYKRKNTYGMYESEGKAVAFHIKKPCIGLIRGFFFVLADGRQVENTL